MASPLSTRPIDPGKIATVIPLPRRRSGRWKWIIGILFAFLVIAGICVVLVLKRAEPILRTRVIETLTARFHSRVELAELHVFILNGLQVSGSGLQIYGATDPNPYEPGVQPILLIQEFKFSTPLRDLFREPMRVQTVYVKGMALNIPPKENRQQMTDMRKHSGKMSIEVSQFICEDTKLLINTLKPGRAPLDFDIGNLKMTDIGAGRPLNFDATLVNPKPVGNIHSTGQFGPLQEFAALSLARPSQ